MGGSSILGVEERRWGGSSIFEVEVRRWGVLRSSVPAGHRLSACTFAGQEKRGTSDAERKASKRGAPANNYNNNDDNNDDNTNMNNNNSHNDNNNNNDNSNICIPGSSNLKTRLELGCDELF